MMHSDNTRYSITYHDAKGEIEVFEWEESEVFDGYLGLCIICSYIPGAWVELYEQGTVEPISVYGCDT